MKLDAANLSKYDLTNAKAGDKIIVGNYNYSFWSFKEVTIKSVSPKRGDITLSNGSKYQKDERKIGVSKWNLQHYSDNFFEYTQENIKAINGYMISMNEANEIIDWFREIEKRGFKMLYDLSEEEISVLHKTMMEIFGGEQNE